jgi:hypothetical protein
MALFCTAFLYQLLRSFGSALVVEYDLRPGGNEQPHDCGAYAARPAGDERDFAF